MSDPSRKTLLLIAALGVTAAAIFLRSLPIAPTVTLVDALVFVTLAALSERWYVATSQESGMSLSFTVHFAAVVLFGPAFAMIVVVAGLVITDGFIRRPPLVRTAFNIVQMAVSVGLSGLSYDLLRVQGPVDLVRDAPAMAVAALVYLVVNDSLVAVVLSVHGRSFLQEWKLSFKDILLPYVSMAPLGALAAYCYQASPWTLVYFIPLVLVVYDGFKLFVSLQHETDSALVALADSIDRRDKYTYEHSMRVSERVAATARALRLPPREAEMMAAAARVHDLGKIATDNRVLLKPTGLSADERRHIEAHSAEGETIAGKFSMFRRGRMYIRHHHERWDGTGYPDGLAGTDIPLGARIIAVADSFDAMTTDRPQRKAIPRDKAVGELWHCAGTQFDPDVVRAFIEALGGEYGQDVEEAVQPAAALQPWPQADLAAELRRGRDSAQLWAAAAFTITRLLDVPDCEIHRLIRGQHLECLASICQGEWCIERPRKRLQLRTWASGRKALSEGRSVLLSSQSEPGLGLAERSEMERWSEHAAAVVPLQVDGTVIGLVEIAETRSERQLTQAQVATCEDLCRLIAVTIHDADATETQKSHLRRLATLLESSRAISSAKNSKEALAVVTHRTAELFDLALCVAYEFDEERMVLVTRAACLRGEEQEVELDRHAPVAESSGGRLLLESGEFALERVSDPGLDPATRADMDARGDKSRLTVVMSSVDGPMGLLTLSDTVCERRYTDEELQTVKAIAELAGEAVRGEKLLRRLRSLSETDALTGLANRRKMQDFLATVHAQAKRQRREYSVMMLDIDGFKALNDTYGHQAGDLVLRWVARVLREQTRAADFVARYGGDEFVLALPDTGREQVAALSEKLAAWLRAHPCETPGGDMITVRASIGTATYPSSGVEVNDLIGVADGDLYASKRAGSAQLADRQRGAERPSGVRVA